MAPPNQLIEHITEIDAPIQIVWEAITDLKNWNQWNKWFTLEAVPGNEKPVTSGQKGKVHACFEGDDKKWNEYDCQFGEVNHDDHVLVWFGNIGPNGCLFSGYHTMMLQESGSGTRLIHTEKFGGILPSLGLGLPFDKLNRNYRLANEGLKAFAEK